MIKSLWLIKIFLKVSIIPISHSLHTKSASISNSSFLNKINSKIIGIFILVLSLILVVVTALSLPLIAPIWSPLIPLGVLILAITIFCILSKPQPLIQEAPKQIVDPETTSKELLPKSPPSTRKSSLSSLLSDDEMQEYKWENSQLALKNSPIRKNASSSSLNTLLSEALNQAFPFCEETIHSETDDL